jgi:hypothetical protein
MTMIDEQTALDWLRIMAGHSSHWRYAQKVQDLLAEPRLPETLSDELVESIWRAVTAAATETLQRTSWVSSAKR